VPLDEIMRVRDVELRFRGGMQPPPSNDGCLYVHKDFALVSAMDRILEQVRLRRMVEIGIHDGGSTVDWHHSAPSSLRWAGTSAATCRMVDGGGIR